MVVLMARAVLVDNALACCCRLTPYFCTYMGLSTAVVIQPEIQLCICIPGNLSYQLS